MIVVGSDIRCLRRLVGASFVVYHDVVMRFSTLDPVHKNNRIYLRPLLAFAVAATVSACTEAGDQTSANGPSSSSSAATSGSPLANSGNTPESESGVSGSERPDSQASAADLEAYLQALEASIPLERRVRVEKAVAAFVSDDESLVGVRMLRVLPVHSLVTPQLQLYEAKLQRGDEAMGYLIVALAKQDARAWVDIYSESKSTRVDKFLEENPQAVGAAKIYLVGPADIAAESDDGTLMAYRGITQETGMGYSDWWTRLKATDFEIALDEVYADDEAIDPEPMDARANGKNCKGNRFKKRIVKNKSLPSWSQFPSEYHGKKCVVGCTPLAVGMVMAWMDVAWDSVDYFNGKAGSHQKVDWWNSSNDSARMIRKIGDNINTFCVEDKKNKGDSLADGGTNVAAKSFMPNINAILEVWNDGHTDIWAEMHWVGRDLPSERGDKLYDELRTKKRPVVLGGDARRIPAFNGSQDEYAGHNWAADGYREPTIKGCEDSKRMVRMNWGWNGSDWVRLPRAGAAIKSMIVFRRKRQECRKRVGHKNYCRDCGPCTMGQGNCTKDSDCEHPYQCLPVNAREYGYKSGTKVCGIGSTSSCVLGCQHDYSDCVNDMQIPGEKPNTSFCEYRRDECLAKC